MRITPTKWIVSVLALGATGAVMQHLMPATILGKVVTDGVLAVGLWLVFEWALGRVPLKAYVPLMLACVTFDAAHSYYRRLNPLSPSWDAFTLGMAAAFLLATIGYTIWWFVHQR
jgi:hypothetical protein